MAGAGPDADDGSRHAVSFDGPAGPEIDQHGGGRIRIGDDTAGGDFIHGLFRNVGPFGPAHLGAFSYQRMAKIGDIGVTGNSPPPAR